MKIFTFIICLIVSFNALADEFGQELAVFAKKQIGITTSYDPAYVKISYPDGDVPLETGVCADVVIRAFREQNIDLQKLIHEDMTKNFVDYPKNWGLSKPDKNIDHRRVPNLQKYFSKYYQTLPNDKNFEAGDIVIWNLRDKGYLPHIGLVSDKKASDGTPLIIHNIGSGVKEENILYMFKITGHYRYKD